MATRAQKAAARRNIKKAQAARRKKARSHGANPAKKRSRGRTTHAANPAKKRRRARRRTRFTVRVGKPRGRKRQRVATVVIQPTTRRRRRRKKAKKPAGPAQLMPNPAKRKTRRRRHRKGTQSIRIRRGSRIVRLFRNPTDGMYYEQNPTDLGGLGGIGGLDDLGGIGGLDSHFAANPGGFEENPGIAGAFSGSNLKNFGMAAGGVALGLFAARVADRYVATMKPKGGNNPWYGANAAAVINSKPDAKRLGIQAVGAAGSIAAAWSLRNRGWAAWLFGGLATGFGANTLMSILDWWIAPSLLKAGSNEVKLGNRLFPLEQAYVQEYVKGAFMNWSSQTHLNAGQTGDPSSPPPTGGADTYTYQLGGAPAQRAPSAPTQLPAAPARVGAPVLPVNRMGACPSCGAESGGCYANCPSLCPECPKDTSATAEITVSPTHAVAGVLRSWANLAGVPIEQVNALNGGTPDQYWRAGNTVKLPYAMGVAYHLFEQGKGPFALAGIPSETSTAPVAAPLAAPVAAPVPPPVAGPSPAPTVFEKPAVNEALAFERKMAADINTVFNN